MRGLRAGTHGSGLEWANRRCLQDGTEKRRNGAPPSVKIPVSLQVWDTLIPEADMSILLVSWSTDESVTQIFLFLFFFFRYKQNQSFRVGFYTCGTATVSSPSDQQCIQNSSLGESG